MKKNTLRGAYVALALMLVGFMYSCNTADSPQPQFSAMQPVQASVFTAGFDPNAIQDVTEDSDPNARAEAIDAANKVIFRMKTGTTCATTAPIALYYRSDTLQAGIFTTNYQISSTVNAKEVFKKGYKKFTFKGTSLEYGKTFDKTLRTHLFCKNSTGHWGYFGYVTGSTLVKKSQVNGAETTVTGISLLNKLYIGEAFTFNCAGTY